MEFNDRVVVITGASTGIGRGLALRFARAGATVLVNSKANDLAGQAVVADIVRQGGKANYVQADVTQPPEVRRLFAEALRQFGRVDILINNAGGAASRAFLEATKDDWAAAMESNLMGAVLCSQEAARIMQQQQWGRIINTSSVRGLEHTGREAIMAYSAAKAALNNFTKTLAKELAPNILVNAVAPGFVYTGDYYDAMPSETIRHFLNQTLIKRFITVEEVAEAYVFLASTAVVTGQILVVDGGFALKIGA